MSIRILIVRNFFLQQFVAVVTLLNYIATYFNCRNLCYLSPFSGRDGGKTASELANAGCHGKQPLKQMKVGSIQRKFTDRVKV